jgi:hypothetical protein
MVFKKKKNDQVDTNKKVPVEKKIDIKKLSLFITIVNQGQADAIAQIFKREGVAAQFISSGTGTAQKEVLDILGIENNNKEIVMSLIKEESIPEIKKELSAYFIISKRNNGVGFSVPMSSIIGLKIYQFLTNTI